MIGLDANAPVRGIMQDEPRQSARATKLIELLDADNPGYVTMVTVVELYWVLTSCYELTGEQAAQALESIIRTRQVVGRHGFREGA